MNDTELIPHLFRTEYRKIIAVLCKLFGLKNIEIAEDIVSDTFLTAAELWGLKGLPANPAAWLYAVAKNKTKDYLKHDAVFTQKIIPAIQYTADGMCETAVDLSDKNINDCQLAMMFAVCDPCISAEAQIGLALNILCGFGAEEIANAFLSNKETIYKRLQRAKKKLKTIKATMALPAPAAINERLDTVLTTLYLLFNEGYCSASQNTAIRKDLCIEAMRLNYLLIENEATNKPNTNALLSLMCFHTSRFDARINEQGEMILYEDQDTALWNDELVKKGEYFLNKAAKGDNISTYHLEAAIAYWHTYKKDTKEKWENILQLYNKLLLLNYSPVAALNRTYALAKVNGKKEAIIQAEKLNLKDNYLYYSLLGNLYSGNDDNKAIENYAAALHKAKSNTDKSTIRNYINILKGKAATINTY